MSKPRIKPLNVPWQISPSMSLFKLSVLEIEKTLLTFSANIYREMVDDEIKSTEVTIDFEWVIWTKTQLALTDGVVINPEKYDWQEIESWYRLGRNLSTSDIAQFNETFQTQWLDSGRCPIPFAYQIISAPEYNMVLDQYPNVDEKIFNHYLFVGREMYIEIICKSFAWQTSNPTIKSSG